MMSFEEVESACLIIPPNFLRYGNFEYVLIAIETKKKN